MNFIYACRQTQMSILSKYTRNLFKQIICYLLLVLGLCHSRTGSEELQVHTVFLGGHSSKY